MRSSAVEPKGTRGGEREKTMEREKVNFGWTSQLLSGHLVFILPASPAPNLTKGLWRVSQNSTLTKLHCIAGVTNYSRTELILNIYSTIKGLVQRKMSMLSLFTSPHVVPNLYAFFILLWNTKEDILTNVESAFSCFLNCASSFQVWCQAPFIVTWPITMCQFRDKKNIFVNTMKVSGVNGVWLSFVFYRVSKWFKILG